MLQMPEAHQVLHAWLINVSNTSNFDGEGQFKNLRKRIQEAKTIWEQAAKELAPQPENPREMLARNTKYQTLRDLDSLAQSLWLIWINRHTCVFADAPKKDKS